MIAAHTRQATPNIVPRANPNMNVIMIFPPHALFPLHILYSNNLQGLLFCIGNTSNFCSRFPCRYIVCSFPVPRLGIVLFLPCSVLLIRFWKRLPSYNICPINFIFTVCAFCKNPLFFGSPVCHPAKCAVCN